MKGKKTNYHVNRYATSILIYFSGIHAAEQSASDLSVQPELPDLDTIPCIQHDLNISFPDGILNGNTQFSCTIPGAVTFSYLFVRGTADIGNLSNCTFHQGFK